MSLINHQTLSIQNECGKKINEPKVCSIYGCFSFSAKSDTGEPHVKKQERGVSAYLQLQQVSLHAELYVSHKYTSSEHLSELLFD
jgi:hypothetical protein